MPGDGKTVSWHQDASYWPLTPSKSVTLWLAIDDADTENAAMRVIPGSHTQQFKHDSSASQSDVLDMAANLGDFTEDNAVYRLPGQKAKVQGGVAGETGLRGRLLRCGEAPASRPG